MPETHLRLYTERFMRARESPYIDYPYCVHLETSTLCAASCHFCPYPQLERKGNVMSDALIAKVISELKAIPQDLAFNLFPYKVSDPFSERRIFNILEMANRELPNARICMITNGVLLSAAKFEQLLTVRNVSFLSISVNDHRPDEYARIMKLKLPTLINRLDAIHEIYASRGKPFPISLTRVRDGSPVDDEFAHWVRQNYPHFHHGLYPRSDWASQVQNLIPESAPDVPCLRWFDLSITSTGVVSLCCMDGHSEYAIGDVNKQGALEVYNTPAFRQLRERVASRRSPETPKPCRRCSILGFDRFLEGTDQIHIQGPDFAQIAD